MKIALLSFQSCYLKRWHDNITERKIELKVVLTPRVGVRIIVLECGKVASILHAILSFIEKHISGKKSLLSVTAFFHLLFL